MKCAHCGDLHITEQKGDSAETLDEQIERLLFIGRDASESGAEILLCGGDVFDRASTPAERNAAVTVFQAWADHFPVLCVKGNNSHDAPGEIKFLGELKAKHEIRVFEQPGHYVTDKDDVIACLPFPEKCWLAARLDADQDIDQAALAAMRTIMHGWSLTFGNRKQSGARVLLAHAEVGSALADSGQPMTGQCYVELSENDLLSSDADYVALNHIHKFQILGGGRICYSGSPRQQSFGETGPKGFVLVTVNRGELPVIEHRQAPGRRLITVEADWIDGELVTDVGDLDNLEAVPEGSIVRLKYNVEEPDRQQAAEQAERAKARLVEGGAYSTKLDPRVTPVSRVRSETIAEAQTNAERLEAYWAARGERPARAEAILGKLGVLEGEVAGG